MTLLSHLPSNLSYVCHWVKITITEQKEIHQCQQLELTGSITHMQKSLCQLVSEFCCCMFPILFSPFLTPLFEAFNSLEKDSICYFASSWSLTKKTLINRFHQKGFQSSEVITIKMHKCNP